MIPINLNLGQKTERPVIIVDGMNIFIRLFVANQATTTSGDPVGGVVGFIKYLNFLTNNFVPKKLVVVWEQGGGSPRRRKIYEGYKANRSKDKDSFKNVSKDSSTKSWLMSDTENRLKQLHLLTQALKNLPVCQVYVPDCECDDIIAYLLRTKLATSPGKKILVSSDKDFYQLLEDSKIEIYDPGKKIFISGQKVLDEHDISARNFVLARTLVGDASDNIPGVEGVGLKTAAKRIEILKDTDKDHNTSDIIAFCEKKIAEGSKIKAYKDIVSSKNILERNWNLMYLSSSDLSASQIQKIDYTYDNFTPAINKLALIKTLLEAGAVSDIDFDRVYSTFKTTLVE